MPLPPGTAIRESICEYSETAEHVIKGNVDTKTGDRVFHVPGDFFYGTTVVEESKGDLWFCTENEATAAGWTKSKY